MRHLRLATVVAVALQLWIACVSTALAQKPNQTATASAGENAVRQASQAYMKALNAGDFKSAAAFWRR